MQTSIPLEASRRLRVSPIVAFGALVVTGVQAAELPEVTVRAPEVTVTAPSSKLIGRDTSGAPVRQVTATARIRYSSIMLTTYSGRALLRDKVAEVARGLCHKLDSVGTVPMDDEGTCVQRAVDGAKVQIAAVMAQRKAG